VDVDSTFGAANDVCFGFLSTNRTIHLIPPDDYRPDAMRRQTLILTGLRYGNRAAVFGFLRQLMFVVSSQPSEVLGYPQGDHSDHDKQHSQDNRELEKLFLDSPACAVDRVGLTEDAAESSAPHLEEDYEHQSS